MTSDTVTVVGFEPLRCQGCERVVVDAPYHITPIDALGWFDAKVYCSLKCAEEDGDD